MKIPDFLIIGAQKSGTSWLQHQLRQHPGIYMPVDKDAPLFFNSTEQTAAFFTRFYDAPAEKLVGDACASYFWTRNSGPYPAAFNSDISVSIRQQLGERLKLLVMLKHPIQRSVSAYLHHIAHGSLPVSCTILNAPKELGIVSLSRYKRHLFHWQRDYATDQLLVLPSPTPTNATLLLNRVFDFLAIEKIKPAINAGEVVFAGLAKKQREDGIWVLLPQHETNLAIQSRELPVQNIDGQNFVRLVHQTELDVLERELHEDIELFNMLDIHAIA
jgi:hypothetical protein